ncbi:ABC transporter ATP-binding protein [Bacillus sp. T33-2]|uniref:ABC transporter ATP-binding protein n=1 Tax=Bacillus sp. T33-2 TaxID=2054168 RepID=UPI000C78C4CC|nr:ABC transporter ATP-binding protein [Bacillus sp. T33-2]PLR95989.1 peptide ABC transporter ATP-binding protein [Bacillus sp. T33-2]
MTALLDVKDLEILFRKDKEFVSTVGAISFQVKEGEMLGIVGESGCGKSVTSLAIMGLLPQEMSRVGSGSEISFKGTSLTKLSHADYRGVRGKDISMIFQDPMTSLNPVLTIGYQMREMVLAHEKVSKREAWNRGVGMLKKVGIPRAEHIMNEYPHQLSGGMRQRVMIAMALLLQPKLLIADEPTTALDVTIQAQILDLLKQIQQDSNTAVILITHDLGVVAEVCDRVVVMYAGKVVESAPVVELFTNPKHPYTNGLLASMPTLTSEQSRLNTIPGSVPLPEEMPAGCRFAPRCSHAMPHCFTTEPPLVVAGEAHTTSCWLYDKEEQAYG